jgi:ADP-ribose pyrophosphatase YjhB (NUDIX family)
MLVVCYLFSGEKFEALEAVYNDNAAKRSVRRKVLEEVGLDLINLISYVRTSYFPDEQNNKRVLDIIYHCRLEKTKIAGTPSSREISKYYWYFIRRNHKCP